MNKLGYLIGLQLYLKIFDDILKMPGIICNVSFARKSGHIDKMAKLVAGELIMASTKLSPIHTYLVITTLQSALSA